MWFYLTADEQSKASGRTYGGMVNVKRKFAGPFVPVSKDELDRACQAGTAAMSSLASLEQSMMK